MSPEIRPCPQVGPIDPCKTRWVALPPAIAFLLLVGTLAGCSPPRPSAPAPVPAPVAKVQAPPAPTAHAVKPVPKQGVAAINIVDARAYASEANRIKRELAKDRQDALLPADVGYYMDVMQGRLQQAAGKRIKIDRQPDRIVVFFAKDLEFDAGTDSLNAAISETIAPVSGVLAEYRMTLVSMKLTTTDPEPQTASDKLNAKRALSVARQLAKSGVAIKRIVVVSGTTNAQVANETGSADRLRLEVGLEPIVLDVAIKP